MKMKSLLIVIIVLFFNMGCEKDSNDDAYSVNIEGTLFLSFVNSQNEDLLNPENSILLKELKLYVTENSSERDINYNLLNGEKSSFYYIRFNPNMDDLTYISKGYDYIYDTVKYECDIYHSIPHYIKTSETDVDTLIIEYHKHQESESSIAIHKIIYNGEDIPKDVNAGGLFTVIKD